MIFRGFDRERGSISVAAMPRPAASVVVVLLLTFANVFLVSCQQGSPQNIETFYPYAPPPSPVPLPPPSPPPIAWPPPPFSTPLQPPPPPTKSSSSNSNTIIKAVLGTAAGSIAISGLVFFLIRMHSKKRPENESAGGGRPPAIARENFHRLDGNVKGLIVDENGLDVLYWRRLQSSNARNGFLKEVMQGQEEGGQNTWAAIGVGSRRRNYDPIQGVPLLREKPTSAFNQIRPVRDVEMLASSGHLPLTSSPPPPLAPPPPPPPTPGTTRSNSPEAEVKTALAIPRTKSDSSSPPPPPPPPAPKSSNTRAPPPPPVPKPINARAPPPLPPPKAGSSAPATSKVPPPLPKGKPENHLETGQIKLKPLHWDKVNTNTDHSMVWNKIGRGSFQ